MAAVEQRFALAEEQGVHQEVKLVDELEFGEGPDYGETAVDHDVPAGTALEFGDLDGVDPFQPPGVVPRRGVSRGRDDRFIAEADALTPDNRFDVSSIDGSHASVPVRPGEAAALLSALVQP